MRIVRSLFAVAALASLVAGCAAKSQPNPKSIVASDVPTTVQTSSGPMSVTPANQKPRLEVMGDMTPNLVRVDKDQEVVVRVRVHGLPMVDKKRPPLNVALVVDTSGSMEGAAIDQARAAVGTLIDLMTEGDFVSIVTFGTHAKVIVPSVKITKESRQAAKAALKNFKAEGTTDMAGGLTEGFAQVRMRGTSETNGIHRLVLVGDGVPNDAPPVLALADTAKAQHVPVTVLGLGNDFDETLMTAVAQHSSGTFHFVDDASRVAAVFKEQISRMERVVARNSHMELVPGPGVMISEVVGIPASVSANGRAQIVDLGDLAEGQTRDIFVRVQAKGRHDGKAMELIDAQVTYTLPEGGLELTASSFMKLNASSDAAKVKDSTVLDIEHGFTTVRVADGIVKAIALARDGELTNARKVLDASLRLAKVGEKKFSDKALGEKVVEMTKLQRTLPSLVPPPEPMGMNESGGGGAPRKAKPSVASPSPAPPTTAKEAMEMKATHGDAMRAIQGE